MDKVKEAAVDKANNGASPPTYHDTPTSSPHPTGDEPPPSDYTIFPRDTVIYRTTYISLILGPQYEAHKPQLKSFEWRHSGDPEVAALAMENLPGEDITQEARGLKLMRVSTGQTVAAFAGGKHQRKINPRRVAGKLRFVGQPVLDPLVVVLTILSIMEKARAECYLECFADHWLQYFVIPGVGYARRWWREDGFEVDRPLGLQSKSHFFRRTAVSPVEVQDQV